LIPSVIENLREAGVNVPVVCGGIIPDHDVQPLLDAGVARVYTPKDFEINRIMGEIADLVAERHRAAQPA
jgi:(2R)-ethylmalonyl-CoA mutase